MLSQKKVKNDGYDDGDEIICSENFLANVHSLSQWFDNTKTFTFEQLVGFNTT